MNSHTRSCLGVGIGAEGPAVDGAPLAHHASARGQEPPEQWWLQMTAMRRGERLSEHSEWLDRMC